MIKRAKSWIFRNFRRITPIFGKRSRRYLSPDDLRINDAVIHYPTKSLVYILNFSKDMRDVHVYDQVRRTVYTVDHVDLIKFPPKHKKRWSIDDFCESLYESSRNYWMR
jgi:hypothetical protein